MEMHPNLKPWQPGQSGNLNGRPIGSRSAFSAGFARDLAEVWAEKGKASMLYTAEKQPATFFATCARLLPNEARLAQLDLITVRNNGKKRALHNLT